MEIRLTVIDPTPEFQQDLLALLARHDDTVLAVNPGDPDNRWTIARARAYHRQLPHRARQILELLAHPDEDGIRSAEDIRSETGLSNLRGSTGAFKRILNEGALSGRWPAALPVPVESITRNGQLVSFQFIGFGTQHDVLDVFKAALHSDTQDDA